MTGHGEGRAQENGTVVVVEVRTINNRYFKLNVRSAESSGALEAAVEDEVRQYVRRGTVQLDLQIARQASPEDFKLNELAVSSYWDQLERLQTRLGLQGTIRLEPLLSLPGVVAERQSDRLVMERDWPLIARALREALENLARMRAEEGAAMARDLEANCRLLDQHLDVIATRAPQVVDAYRARLTDRLNQLLAQYDIKVEAADVVREVGIFAERSDISEEIVRLRSHLEQFATIMQASESSGRKLDFLTQEMFRETNTIGSKANDAEVARQVVEMKTAIERIREMVQNVE